MEDDMKIDFKCPKCGDFHTVRYGYNVTKSGRFARRKCLNCGSTFYEDKKKKMEDN